MNLATSKERLLQYLENKDIDKSTFYEKTGIKRGLLDADKLKSTLSDQFIAKIIAIYEDLNLEWLITGKGLMISNNKIRIPESQFGPESQDKKPVAVPIASQGIPLVEIEAVGGFGNASFSINAQDIIGNYSIPDFDQASFMIRVRGDSMSPHYKSGDLVACKVLRESQFIQWNEVHVIATLEQGILIKRLRKGIDNETLLAVSENPDYSPFDIPKEEITGIALVLGGVRLE